MADSSQSLTEPTKTSEAIEHAFPPRFKVGDHVRIKEFGARKGMKFLKDMDGALGVIETIYDRPMLPFKLVGISQFLNGEELVPATGVNTLPAVIDKPVTQQTTRTYTHTPYVPKPKPVYWNVKDVCQ